MANISTQKRQDIEYTEIETFKNHELSYCIAFEMLKRDPLLLKNIDRFILFFQKNKERITLDSSNIDDFETSFEYRLHRRAQSIFVYWFKSMKYTFWLNPLDFFHVRREEIIVDILECYYQLVPDEAEGTSRSKVVSVEMDGASFTSSIDFNNEYYFRQHPNPTDEEIVQAIRNFDMDPCQVVGFNEAIVLFSRPRLSAPAMYNKNFMLDLNMALPEKELLDYLSHIKKAYDKSKEDIQSVTELLGVDLSGEGIEEADPDQMYKRDRRKTLAEKLADLFFVYDCHINKVKVEDTIDSLDVYWREERKAFPDKFQKKTYQHYLRLAKDFIENQKYKSLLIGQ